MIKYQVFKKRNHTVWLEVENPQATWGWLVVETRNKAGYWDREAIRLPIDGLRNAVAKLTIHHEVSP